MLAKELGWILSIDEASNSAGVSLWRDGEFRASTTVRSGKASDAIGKRLATQITQLEAWLDSQIGQEEIKVVLFEGVRARLVLITVGAFTCCTHLRNCRLHPRHSFIESTSWKYWAQKRGATGAIKDIKGITALVETGWDALKFPLGSDDEADSVMIYLTWRDRV